MQIQNDLLPFAAMSYKELRTSEERPKNDYGAAEGWGEWRVTVAKVCGKIFIKNKEKISVKDTSRMT